MSATSLFDEPVGTPDAPDPLPEGRRVELIALPAATALNRQTGRSRRWFDWSANPYRGCEFGCDYCYARYSHEFLGHEHADSFQDTIYVKRGFARALRRDLRTRVRAGEHIAFGTATDPYQPIEGRERVMRAALKELVGAEGLRISITTKGRLVVRDLDLLGRIAQKNSVQVNVTITTPDRRLARLIEPRAPAPRLRFRTVRDVRRAGLHAGIFLMPVLPGVTDSDSDLVSLYRAARDAGAEFVAPAVVFLREPSRSYFLGRLRRHYPRVAARYEVWTRTGSRLPQHVNASIHRRLDAISTRFGIPNHPREEAPPPPVEHQATFPFA